MSSMSDKSGKTKENSEKTGKKPEKVSEKLIPEINIGMVGHVDHGKTSLTKALTGRWTDTHSEEIKRGITIRLGYADATFYKCSKCKGHDAYGTTQKCIKCFSDCEPLRTVSFVDAPGHETLMTTVLSGASLMDGALLVISANEPCPQPQTREHLIALNIIRIKKIVIIQNKIDLVTEKEAMQNYKQIKKFLKGSIAENAPIVPVSAQHMINIDALIETIEKDIPTPERDPKKDPKIYVARSFDINKPGTKIEKLIGGVLGGSIVQGKLNIGNDIEIKPGIKIKDKFKPITTKVTGLQKAMKNLQKVSPGGLLGISTELDPSLTKSDSLSGNVISLPGKLPPLIYELSIKTELLERVVGSKEDLKLEPPKIGEILMVTLGTMRTLGTVTSTNNKEMKLNLRIPLCADKDERIAISKQIMGRWRLIGWGEIE